MFEFSCWVSWLVGWVFYGTRYKEEHTEPDRMLSVMSPLEQCIWAMRNALDTARKVTSWTLCHKSNDFFAILTMAQIKWSTCHRTLGSFVDQSRSITLTSRNRTLYQLTFSFLIEIELTNFLLILSFTYLQYI